MANRDVLEKRMDADLAALYWWRRDGAMCAEPENSAPLTERLTSTVARAASSTPRSIDLRGNRLRAKAAMRRVGEAQAATAEIALAPDFLAAIRNERRNARAALALGLIATATAAAAAIHAATMREPVALCFAIAGGCAASYALCHAAHWFLLPRADAPPKILG
jgi:hypothetical protein